MSSTGRSPATPSIPSAGDLARSMIWPRLLRAGGLALRPSRVGLALTTLVLIAMIAQAPKLWLDGREGPGAFATARGGAAASRMVEGVIRLDHVALFDGLSDLAVATPAAVVGEYPWSLAIILVPVLLVWCVGGAAISRSVASEFALRERTPWPRALAFGLSKWASTLGAKLTPLLFALFIVLVMAAGGWVLLRFPGLQVVGGVVYALALVGGLVVVLVGLGYVLGGCLLIPVIACEGTDAIDAIQRAYAYPFARPLRLVLYALVLVVELVLLALLLGAISHAVTGVAAWAASLFLPEGLAHEVRSVANGETVALGDAGWSRRTVVDLIGFWSRIPGMLVAAFVVSFYFSGSTLLYLLMRQVCDGQDPSELWRPGRMPGVASIEPKGESLGDEE